MVGHSFVGHGGPVPSLVCRVLDYLGAAIWQLYGVLSGGDEASATFSVGVESAGRFVPYAILEFVADRLQNRERDTMSCVSETFI